MEKMVGTRIRSADGGKHKKRLLLQSGERKRTAPSRFITIKGLKNLEVIDRLSIYEEDSWRQTS